MMVLWEKSGVMMVFTGVTPVLCHNTEKNRQLSIFRSARRIPPLRDFRDVFTSSRYSTLPSEQHPEGFTFHSTMFKYMDSTEVTGGEILGGKTGYTEEAGLCLASLAQVNGKEYILVTAKANGTHQTEQFHILDGDWLRVQIHLRKSLAFLMPFR